MSLPPLLREPNFYVSILMPVFNTSRLYLKECLESIKCQKGYFGIELVCINDGCDDNHRTELEEELDDFMKKTRFTRLVYHKFENNLGISCALKKGLEMCTNELIFRMDADDIMLPDRINTQIEFIKQNPDCVMVGTNVKFFKNENSNNLKEKTFLNTTNHPLKLTWDEFLRTKPSWFMNHPSLCFRKSAVLSVGNYNEDAFGCLEDYELEVKIMKKHGFIYNIREPLVFYRLHDKQLTHEMKDNNELREKIINEVNV
jgi:glycosyltransferase involved in cell wall biosynthesis